MRYVYLVYEIDREGFRTLRELCAVFETKESAYAYVGAFNATQPEGPERVVERWEVQP
jgi:hypothetical protein